MTSDESSPVSQELLNILACPACKTPVRLEGNKLVCDDCNRRYRIENGIPIMLIDEAEIPESDGSKSS
jgi:uncharacterized protein